MTERLKTIEETWDKLDVSFRGRKIQDYESYKDVPGNLEHIFWLQAPDLIGGLIERGEATFEDMEQANTNYKDFIFYLEKEWPPERIKAYVVQKKREQYAKTKKYIEDLELKNRDARVAGVGFKERQEKYVKKIGIGERVLAQYAEEGKALKNETFSVSSLVTPLDMGVIKKDGFEKYLYYRLLFGYPQGE